jgi:hypothetical protein
MASENPENRKPCRRQTEPGDGHRNFARTSLGLPRAELKLYVGIADRALIHRGREHSRGEVGGTRSLRRAVPLPGGGEYNCGRYDERKA